MLTVFGDLLSQPSRAVLIFCKANKIPHKFKEVKIMGAVQQTVAYKKINPLATVPCIRDGDFTLRDSGAILAYLANSRPDLVKDHWYPKDLESRARVDEYLSWHHLNTRVGGSQYLLMKWIRPLMTGKPSKPKNIARAIKFKTLAFDKVENVWLDEGRAKFVNDTDEITLADLQLACELEQPILAGYDVRRERPILAGYLERVRAELNPHYDEVHQKLYDLANLFPNGQVPSRNWAILQLLKIRLKLITKPLS